MDKKIKIIIIHGNSGSTPKDNWIPYVKRELEKTGVLVLAPQFPDNQVARESVWIPFLEEELKADEYTILIGHSSGAIASMRYAEKKPILGSILVAAYHSDLGIENERQSGYFNRPWQWDKIKRNQQWIVQFSATNDPWIPIEEPRFVHEKLNSEYYELDDQGHFGGDYCKETFPELVEIVKRRIKASWDRSKKF
jgi:predicted alpha/beta hydrolase family esterase